LPEKKFEINNVDEFKTTIWECFHKYLKSHTRVTETDNSVSSSHLTVLNSLYQHAKVNFFEYTTRFQSVATLFLFSKTIYWVKWKERKHTELELRIYPYESDIDHESFNRILQANNSTDTDRAGAAKEEKLSAVKTMLKDRFCDTFNAVDMVWRMWTNDIINSEVAANANILDGVVCPPLEIAHLFTLEPQNSISQMATERRRANAAAIRALNIVRNSL
jgi:hypothetical protein